MPLYIGDIKRKTDDLGATQYGTLKSIPADETASATSLANED